MLSSEVKAAFICVSCAEGDTSDAEVEVRSLNLMKSYSKHCNGPSHIKHRGIFTFPFPRIIAAFHAEKVKHKNVLVAI
jgi:hypothetical protein